MQKSSISIKQKFQQQIVKKTITPKKKTNILQENITTPTSEYAGDEFNGFYTPKEYNETSSIQRKKIYMVKENAPPVVELSKAFEQKQVESPQVLSDRSDEMNTSIEKNIEMDKRRMTISPGLFQKFMDVEDDSSPEQGKVAKNRRSTISPGALEEFMDEDELEDKVVSSSKPVKGKKVNNRRSTISPGALEEFMDEDELEDKVVPSSKPVKGRLKKNRRSTISPGALEEFMDEDELEDKVVPSSKLVKGKKVNNRRSTISPGALEEFMDEDELEDRVVPSSKLVKGRVKKNRRSTISPGALEGLMDDEAQEDWSPESVNGKVVKNRRSTISPGALEGLMSDDELEVDLDSKSLRGKSSNHRRSTVSPGALEGLMLETMHSSSKQRRDTISPNALQEYEAELMDSKAQSGRDSVHRPNKRRSTISPGTLQDYLEDSTDSIVSDVVSTNVKLSSTPSNRRNTLSPSAFEALMDSDGDELDSMKSNSLREESFEQEKKLSAMKHRTVPKADSTGKFPRNTVQPNAEKRASRRNTVSPSAIMEFMDDSINASESNSEKSRRNSNDSNDDKGISKSDDKNLSPDSFMEFAKNAKSDEEDSPEMITRSATTPYQQFKIGQHITQMPKETPNRANLSMFDGDTNMSIDFTATPSLKLSVDKFFLKSCLSAKKRKNAPTPNKSVMFGSPRASKFYRDSPPSSMTPMCNKEAKKMFPLDASLSDSENKHEEVDDETNLNTSILDSIDSKSPSVQSDSNASIHLQSPLDKRRKRRLSSGPRSKRKRRPAVRDDSPVLDLRIDQENIPTSSSPDDSPEGDDMDITENVQEAVQQANLFNIATNNGLRNHAANERKSLENSDAEDKTVVLGSLGDLVFEGHVGNGALADAPREKDEAALHTIHEESDLNSTKDPSCATSELVVNLSAQFDQTKDSISISASPMQDSLFLEDEEDEVPSASGPSVAATQLLDQLRSPVIDKNQQSLDDQAETQPMDFGNNSKVNAPVATLNSFFEFIDLKFDNRPESLSPTSSNDFKNNRQQFDMEPRNSKEYSLIFKPHEEIFAWGCNEIRQFLSCQEATLAEMVDALNEEGEVVFKEWLSRYNDETRNERIRDIYIEEQKRSRAQWYTWRTKLTRAIRSSLEANYEEIEKEESDMKIKVENRRLELATLEEDVACLDKETEDETKLSKIVQTIQDQARIEESLKQSIAELEQKRNEILTDTRRAKNELLALEAKEKKLTATNMELQSSLTLASKVRTEYKLTSECTLWKPIRFTRECLDLYIQHPGQSKTRISVMFQKNQVPVIELSRTQDYGKSSLLAQRMLSFSNWLFHAEQFQVESEKHLINGVEIAKVLSNLEDHYRRLHQLHRDVEDLLKTLDVAFEQHTCSVVVWFAKFDTPNYVNFPVKYQFSHSYPKQGSVCASLEPPIDTSTPIRYGSFTASTLTNILQNTAAGDQYLHRLCAKITEAI